MIRLDCVSENVKVAAVHYAFREHHTDQLSGESSFRFGTSPANIVSIFQSYISIIKNISIETRIGITIYKQNRDDDIQEKNINICNPHSQM